MGIKLLDNVKDGIMIKIPIIYIGGYVSFYFIQEG